MNFNSFKKTLKYKNYSSLKILIRFIEYTIKNFIYDLIIKFNIFKKINKPIINIGSFKDDRYINFFIFSLKKDFLFSYSLDHNTKKLLNRIGLKNFFKFTISNTVFNYNKYKFKKLTINKKILKQNEINIDTNYFQYFYFNKLKDKKKIFMPYYMYPRIYNNFYDNIIFKKEPNYNLRIFFSGSIFKEVYGNFKWIEGEKKFPTRNKLIDSVINEFKKEVFIIRSKKDLSSDLINKRKIILCLHDKMVKKTSYLLNFKKNFEFLSQSCFNLNCPGAVMPLCHHIIEGIKVGSIPITNSAHLFKPNITMKEALIFNDIESLFTQIDRAIHMKKNKIREKRQHVLKYYEENLSPKAFRDNFFKKIVQDDYKEIISCDDHRSVNLLDNI